MMIILILLFILLSIFVAINNDNYQEDKQRQAGKYGENLAAGLIERIKDKDDILLNNIQIIYDGKETELDNVIICHRGVFIIEVKNYSGVLAGEEQDHRWTKYHVSRGGKTYIKHVDNPIGQVKRQIYMLSKYLRYYGIDVWVEGYVYFIEENSPVESDYILQNEDDIYDILHQKPRRYLKKKTVEEIVQLLSKNMIE